MENQMLKPLREFQASNRERLGCKFGADGEADIDSLMSTPMSAFSGNTLETLIRDLYARENDYFRLRNDLMDLRYEISDLERRLGKRDKLLNWCAKRIRRTLRLRAKYSKHEGK